MKIKEYNLRTGEKVTFEYDEYGVGKITLEGMDLIMSMIESRPKGEWIWSPRDTDGTVSGCCSNCSFSHLFTGGHTAQYNYCPNCGARMKGADDGSC